VQFSLVSKLFSDLLRSIRRKAGPLNPETSSASRRIAIVEYGRGLDNYSTIYFDTENFP